MSYICYPLCKSVVPHALFLQAAEPQTMLPTSSSGGGKLDVKSNLNPASVPFVPASMKAASVGPPAAKAAAPTIVQQVTVSCPPQQPPPQSASAAGGGADSDLEDSDIKSPISLVHECALKRNLTVSFEIVKEVGPPHMRTFVMKCVMGEVSTQGEGNGKRVRIFHRFILILRSKSLVNATKRHYLLLTQVSWVIFEGISIF